MDGVGALVWHLVWHSGCDWRAAHIITRWKSLTRLTFLSPDLKLFGFAVSNFPADRNRLGFQIRLFLRSVMEFIGLPLMEKIAKGILCMQELS